MKTGMVFDVERFATKDGPGIRTVVFMKGCNMRCSWCHNPEGLCFSPELLYDEKKCMNCGMCAGVCSNGAHAAQAGRHVFDRSLCKACLRCTQVCCTGALQTAGREYTADELLKLLLQDAPYYKYSGGGVTFSGGEALCQKDFVAEVAAACRAEGLETDIETNLFHKFDEIKLVLEKMTLIMADIKLMDCDAHMKWTGVPNELILENAKKLGELGIPIIFRTPLIPGVTDTEENLIDTAKFVAQIPNVLYYELLNFNPLGADKYTALRMDNQFRSAKPLPKARLAQIEAALKDCGVNIKIS